MRTRTRSRPSTPATGPASRPPGSWTRSCLPGAPSTPSGAIQAHGERRLCSSTASTTSRRWSWTRSRRWRHIRAPTWSSRFPMRPAANPSGRSPASMSGSCRWPTDTVVLDASDEHYAADSRAALHHLERGLFERDLPEPHPPGDAVRLHSAGGDRAEVELVAAEVLELLRAGTQPGDVAVVFRRPGEVRIARPAGLRCLRHPLFDRGADPVRPHRARARPPRPAEVRPARARGHRRGPAHLAAHPGPARARRPRRPARGRRARGGCPQRGRGARDLGGDGQPLEARRARLAAAGRAARAAAGGAGPAAGPAVRRPLPTQGTPARRGRAGRRARLRGRPQGARRDAGPGGRLLRRPPYPRHARRAAGAGGGASPARPGAGGRPGQHPRPALRGGVRLRAPGGRVPPPHARPTRSCPTTSAGRSPPPAGCCCRCARTSSSASATCSTSARRGPSGCSCSPRRYCDEEGGPDLPSFFVADVARPVRRPGRRAAGAARCRT